MSGCSEGSTGSGRLQPSMPRMRPTWKLSPEFDPTDELGLVGAFGGILLSRELSVLLTPESESATRPATWLRAAGIVLASSIFVAVCAHIALPLYFTPVPLTLQPFAVLLLGLVLSPRLAAASLVTYLTEGALGLPVFAPGLVFSGGMAHLLGPTGGDLLSRSGER